MKIFKKAIVSIFSDIIRVQEELINLFEHQMIIEGKEISKKEMHKKKKTKTKIKNLIRKNKKRILNERKSI